MGKNGVSLLLFSALWIASASTAAADWSILGQWRRRSGGGGDLRMNLKKYCEGWRMNVELDNIRDFDAVPEECAEFVGKYMTSEQYRVDSGRAVEEASLYLRRCRCCAVEGDGKDAWVFDVDDTLLSTLPYYEEHNFGGEVLNMSSLEGWMRERKAPALKDSLAHFNEVKGRGMKIFLVSSRREPLRSATVDNLIKAGFHGWSALILRGAGDEHAKAQEYKADARLRLVNEGYRLHAVVGDQWSSLKGLPAAKRTFKLPNPLYYVS